MKRKNYFSDYILFILIIVLAIIIALSSKNETKKDESGVSDDFFSIQDSVIAIKSDNLIENLDLKKGFKNLIIGTNFKEYNFNPYGWNISESYDKKVIECTTNAVRDIYINGVQLKNINLIFFNSILISIEVNSQLSKEKYQNTGIFNALTNLYGKPNLDKPLLFPPSDNSVKSNSIDNSQNDKNEIVLGSLNNMDKIRPGSNPIVSIYDSETGMYYRIESYCGFVSYWHSELLYLEYKNKCVVKQYDPEIEKTGFPSSKFEYLFTESTEYFSISEKVGLTNYNIYLEKERKRIEQERLRYEQEKIDKESDKL